MHDEGRDRFYAEVPVFDKFEDVADPANYRPLPDGWLLALADIEGSTGAILDGRYKDVNMAGASVISGVLNAVGKGDYPFVFGGDGALLALPPEAEDAARKALSAVRSFVREELGLTMRAAIVPVRAVRAAGHDVMVARFAPSPFVTYAMFGGGGTSFAEAEMKAGRYMVEPAPSGTLPDLTGLSCRWDPIAARHGEIASIIAVPALGAEPRAFLSFVTELVALTAGTERGGHPVPVDGPVAHLDLKRLSRESRATAKPGHRLWRALAIAAQVVLVRFLNLTGILFGRFDARRYRREVAGNSDFRKFDDGLKMTLDLDSERLAAIEARLKRAEREGLVRYGLHRQAEALMTCFVPTPLSTDHIHFIDGASGGYAMAAAQIQTKARAAET